MKTDELPQGWKSIPLGKCCRIVSGSTPKRNVQEYWDGDIAWVTPKDISGLDQSVLSDSPEKITQLGYSSCSATLLPKGSILFSSRAPIGLIAITGKEMCTNQGFKSLIPGKELDSGYLYHCIKRLSPRLADLGNGATFKEVSKEIVSRFEIPLPPLLEQKRIAAILDKADAIRRKRRQALALADQFLRAVFLEMFGDPVTNPKGWPTKTFAEISEKFSDGPFGSNLKSTHYVNDGVRVIRLQNVGVDELIDADKAFISEEHFASLPKHHCSPGDIIIGTLGDPNLRAFIVPDYLTRSLNKADCVQLRPNKDHAIKEYLCSLINDPGTLSLASHLLHGQTRTRISMGTLKQLAVPSPPLHEQQRYSKIYQSIKSAQKKLIRLSEENDLLLLSLTQRAFRGKL